MKIKLLFLLLISIPFYNTIFGQTATSSQKNNLEFLIGYNSGALINLEFAPVSRYDYNGLLYKLNYERTSKNENLFEIQLDYLNSELKSDLIPILNTEYSKIGLGFSYLKQIYNKNSSSLHIGLQSQTSISLYSNSRYFVAHQVFGIASRFAYKLSEAQYFTSKLTIPLALLRVTKNSDFNTYSLNRYQSVLWNLEYGYSLSAHFNLKANYNFNYGRLQVSNSYRELQHQINLGINYKF